MNSQIRSEVIEFIIASYLYGDVTATPEDDDDLVEAGIIDSTGVLELIEFLESNFGIEVAEGETISKNLGSISALTRFVTSKRLIHDSASTLERAT